MSSVVPAEVAAEAAAPSSLPCFSTTGHSLTYLNNPQFQFSLVGWSVPCSSSGTGTRSFGCRAGRPQERFEMGTVTVNLPG